MTSERRTFFGNAHFLPNIADALELLDGWLNDHSEGNLYCPACGAERRMGIENLCGSVPLGNNFTHRAGFPNVKLPPRIDPKSLLGRLQLWRFVCGECRSAQIAFLCSGPAGSQYHIIPPIGGGLSTPRTPASVRYYLELASRCESSAAAPAAIAMYRCALEHLLLEQGFTDRMLGPKIIALEKALAEDRAPRWAKELDAEYLKVVKDLGNWSLHADSGDIDQRRNLDPSLLREIAAVFVLLLQEVYELPLKRATQLDGLRKVRDELKATSKSPAKSATAAAVPPPTPGAMP